MWEPERQQQPTLLHTGRYFHQYYTLHPRRSMTRVGDFSNAVSTKRARNEHKDDHNLLTDTLVQKRRRHHPQDRTLDRSASMTDSDRINIMHISRRKLRDGDL